MDCTILNIKLYFGLQTLKFRKKNCIMDCIIRNIKNKLYSRLYNLKY